MNVKELEGWIGSNEVTEDLISVGLEKDFVPLWILSLVIH